MAKEVKSMLARIRHDINIEIRLALAVLGEIPSVPDISVEAPAFKEHGDLACNVALQLSKQLKRNPLEIAGSIKAALDLRLAELPLKGVVSSVEVLKPGFINFRLTPGAYRSVLKDIRFRGQDFGRTNSGKGKRVLVEFVSANPTGPLTVAHARQAAVGDVLVNVLNATGHYAEREFYVNDGGNQIRTLGKSVQLRTFELFGATVDYPEDCYQGGYIHDMAKIFADQKKIASLDAAKAVAVEEYSGFGKSYLMDVIREDLRLFRVKFDNWSFESEIATPEKIEETLEDLRHKGFIYEKEGALWFKSTQFGDDKDRVVKKSDGFYTYLAPDIVYHKYKYSRGFDLLVDILGPDHHGYIPRIKAAAAALGKDVNALEGLIIQLATIFRDGKQLRMSTRAGEFISLREVVTEVGTDAGRFFMLMRQVNQQLEFDIDLAKKQAPENPVYYIQYAHARIHRILDKAKDEAGLLPAEDFLKLAQEEELDLIKKIAQFPEFLDLCAKGLDPSPLTRYMQELAGVFHRFYDRCRVIDEDKTISSERLALIDATRVTLANGLKLLGVTAPEKM
ncbi:MAG: arginine--tRNA ligase [Candidatus Omnitrophica bacterium]|nr:arginine--tRNA ligase [Candidatus Omnitrophota bacterium]